MNECMSTNKIQINSPTEIIIDQDVSPEIRIILKSEQNREEEKYYTLVKTKSNKLLLNRSATLYR